MTEHPPLDAPVAFLDTTGREQRLWRDGEFEILFWIDQSIRELRVPEVEFVRD
jgi:hypothetical protein